MASLIKSFNDWVSDEVPVWFNVGLTMAIAGITLGVLYGTSDEYDESTGKVEYQPSVDGMRVVLLMVSFAIYLQWPGAVNWAWVVITAVFCMDSAQMSERGWWFFALILVTGVLDLWYKSNRQHKVDLQKQGEVIKDLQKDVGNDRVLRRSWTSPYL